MELARRIQLTQSEPPHEQEIPTPFQGSGKSFVTSEQVKMVVATALILGGAYFYLDSKFTTLSSDINNNTLQLGKLEERIEGVQKDVARIEKDIAAIEGKIDGRPRVSSARNRAPVRVANFAAAKPL